jgi:hypothetical protein
MYDHIKEECPKARKDLRTDRTLGYLVAAFLAPLYFTGLIAGCFFSALKAGFMGATNVWQNAWELIRKKPDPPESA